MIEMPTDLTASERLMLMFLKLYEVTHDGRGATKEEIVKGTGIAGRTFERSWKTLQGRNFLSSRRVYELTDDGRDVAEQLAG